MIAKQRNRYLLKNAVSILTSVFFGLEIKKLLLNQLLLKI